MHKQQLELGVNEPQQWTSNKLESRRLYKESLVILIPTLPSDCSPALHITRRHPMAMLIHHQVLGEEEVETSETMILSVTLRPEQWGTASCTRINGTDVLYAVFAKTTSVLSQDTSLSSRLQYHGRFTKAEQAIADSMLFRQEALPHQCKASAHCPIDFRRLGWVRKSIQPSHGYPESISRDFAGWRLLPA